MSSMSDFVEDALRTLLFRTDAGLTKPSVIAIALHTGIVTDEGVGAEVADANGYARQVLNPADANWSAPDTVDGLTANLAEIVFPTIITDNWGIVTHVALWDSATWGAGNLLFHNSLPSVQPTSIGDILKFPIGTLIVVLS